MIQLQAKVAVAKLKGIVQTVPKALGGKLQVKRVAPTYEEQTIKADEDYDGLSAVIVEPKPRPLTETFCTDVPANHIVSAVDSTPGGVLKCFSMKGLPKYSYNGMVLPGIDPEILAHYQYAIIRGYESNGTYDLLITSLPAWYNPTNNSLSYGEAQSPMYIYRVPFSTASSAEMWNYDAHGAGLCILDNKTLVWSNHDIPNGSATATDIYFEGSEPVLAE